MTRTNAPETGLHSRIAEATPHPTLTRAFARVGEGGTPREETTMPSSPYYGRDWNPAPKPTPDPEPEDDGEEER